MSWTAATDTPGFDSPVRDSGRPAVRLTRRGRVLVLLTLVGVLLAAFSLGRTATQASIEATPRTALQSTTVHSGETLWAVAQRVAPGHDPRHVIFRIQRLNHLDSSTLQVGQQLLLPRAA